MDNTEVQDENEIDEIEHIKYIEVDTPKKKSQKRENLQLQKDPWEKTTKKKMGQRAHYSL